MRKVIIIITLMVLGIGLSMVSVNPHAFAFPVNGFLLFGLIYASLLSGKLSETFHFLSGKKAALIVCIYIIFLMILHWLFYHRRIFYDTIFSPALYEFDTSALFIVSWMLFLVVLGAVIIRRINLKKYNNYPFLLNHFGLWLVLVAGFLGRTDSYTMQTSLTKGDEISYAFTPGFQKMEIPFLLRLEDVKTESDSSGKFVYYGATLRIGEKEYKKNTNISVNHPCRYKGYDIYLMNARNDSCKLQIVYDPWRFVVLAGIIMMIIASLWMFFIGFKKATLT